MKHFPFFLLLLIAFSQPIFLRAQEPLNINTISSYAPPSLAKLQEKLKERNMTVNTENNPFYLRGDFNGDKTMDLAVMVIDDKQKNGIMITHGNSENSFFISYHHPNKPTKADLLIPYGIGGGGSFWHVLTNEEAKARLKRDYKTNNKIVGEAINQGKMEAFSGMIYWNGKKYVWIGGGC